MFRGVNLINLDNKSRLVMPAKWRSILANFGNSVVITIDAEEKCLLLYPLSSWTEIEEKINNLPSFNKVARKIQRLFIGHATDIEMDGAGRILLPALLKEYANIDKKIILVGQGKKIEIWDEDYWRKSRDSWLKESLENAEFPEKLMEIAL